MKSIQVFSFSYLTSFTKLFKFSHYNRALLQCGPFDYLDLIFHRLIKELMPRNPTLGNQTAGDQTCQIAKEQAYLIMAVNLYTFCQQGPDFLDFAIPSCP